ncbi:putative MFS phospholipid transporter (Git1) [Aspergillus melleus]|uniref:putative MFS phospholipid transporter (Git1) n=1 Tax=Aspergillus melleus TaxID=138277 RepID=UPI001E8CF7DE|nr:glycerophosphoinositol permease [Aspergillus melleus]KAH8427714.1 glycerophosphoinositol permease [Aspergillus melleus]
MDPKTEHKVAEMSPEKGPESFDAVPLESGQEQMQKGRWERSWPTIACGAGLFSDGYLNGVIGPVNTILGQIYPDTYKNSPASQNVAAITFAGTVLGQLVFGYLSDHWSRKWSLMISTIILILFGALCAGSYGLHGSTYGMFAALTAYRFFLGIGIGGEYPAGSVAAAENTNELKSGHRNRWFIMFSNFQIDFAYVVSALVAMILVLIFSEDHLRAVWRIALGLGVIPPLSLFYLRLKLNEPEQFDKERMHKFPIWLIVKFYWKRLTVVSLIWFIYDFSAYSFNIYSSKWIAIILGDSAPLWKSFGWTTVTNAFYIPGSFLGALASDWIGPRNTLALGVGLQGIIGFIMSGCYKYLATPENVAAFVVVFG